MPVLEVAGLPVHHERRGEGPPLVLLHGGLGGSEAWGALLDLLAAAGFGVVAPDRRGHGRTPDVDGPLSYAGMAEETAAFLDALAPGPAHVLGWSDGAAVGALLAMSRPDLVARLVLVGQYFDDGGKVPGSFLDDLEAMRHDPPAALRDHYAAVSADGPEHFPVFLGKTLDLWAAEPRFDLAAFAGVRAPTLVLQGDRDLVRLEHSAQVAATVPDGRLAVLPGTHALPQESPALVAALVTAFLRGELPGTASWG